MTKIKEIFKSIQGEGRYIGYEQLFVRFCGCNLNCHYCDTDFDKNEVLGEFTPQALAEYVKSLDLTGIHSISLTGGEPLLSYKFLKEFLPLTGQKIYLETNATMYKELAEVIDFVDYIAADIKLKSSTGVDGTFDMHDKFFEVAKGKDIFAKIVFGKNITEDEITQACELANKYDLELILQPQMNGDEMVVTSEFAEDILNKFLKKYSRTRLIPQVHKFLNVR